MSDHLHMDFLICGLPPPRGSGITMDDFPNRGFSWVLRESPFPLRSRGSGGLPQPPGANTRTPFLSFLGDPVPERRTGALPVYEPSRSRGYFAGSILARIDPAKDFPK